MFILQNMLMTRFDIRLKKYICGWFYMRTLFWCTDTVRLPRQDECTLCLYLISEAESKYTPVIAIFVYYM